jgi:methionyl-tRNA formyltransferase
MIFGENLMLKVCFLFDKKNNWINKFVNKKRFRNNTSYKFFFTSNLSKIKNFEIVFILGYTKILSNTFLKKNRFNLVVHESNLPLGKGFAPVQWQILENKKKINVCIINADKKVDTGGIYLKESFKVDETALYDEIRESQGKATYKIINNFLKKFPRFKIMKQKGKSSFYKRRTKKDSELNINKTIKDQFNLLKICNNNKWPAFFVYKGKKFTLTINKEKKKL